MDVRALTEAGVLVLLLVWVIWWRSAARRRDLMLANARFQALYAAVPVGVVEIGADHAVTHCNAGFAEMVGLPAEQVVGHNGWDFFHPDGSPPDRSPVDDLLAGRRSSYSAERHLRGRDGSALAVQLDWAVIPAAHGESARLVCVFTDTSVQARANAALREARERAEVLWVNAPVGIVETTPEGIITSVNDALAQMLGYRQEDLVGTPATELVDAADAPVILASVAHLQAAESYTAERTYRSADGRPVPVYVSTAVLHDSEGAVSRLAGFVIDMTVPHAQRAALSSALEDADAVRAELARRQRFTEGMLETVDVGIVACDASGKSVTRNRAERALLGIPDTLQGASGEELAPTIDVLDAAGTLLAPDDYPIARSLRGETLHALDFKVGPAGGPYRDVVMRGSRITAADGTTAGAVVALTDVTAERTASRELALEHSRLNDAQRLGQLGSFMFDAVSGEFSFSDQLYRIWGVSRDTDLASLQGSLVHPDDRQRVTREWNSALLLGGEHTGECRIVRPDGSVRHLRVVLDARLGPDGTALVVHGTHLDVTDVTLAQRKAVEASSLFQAILTATPDYTFVSDIRTGAVVYGSPGKTILGITTDRLSSLGPAVIAALVHPEEQPRLMAANAAAEDLADGEVMQIRYQARHADGSWHWLSRRVTPFRRDPSSGAVIEVLGVVRDVTDVVEAEQHLTYTALHDPLTGLPNRALLMDRLDAALGRTDHGGREVAILFCDLDGFKRVNDTAGHAAGDAVLLETASRLTSALREHDTVARVGGDEFVVVIEPWKRSDVIPGDRSGPDSQQGSAERDRALVVGLAERISLSLRRPITVDGVEHVVTVSIGVTYAGQSTATAANPLTADAVLQDADAAMYRAKNTGKDRFEIFEHGLRTDLAERGRVEQVLRQALDPTVPPHAAPLSSPGRRPHLTAAYQPIVDGRSGTLLGFEALARLTDADGLPIPPDVFINIAENTALIGPLGDLMLDRACAQLATWRRELPAMQDVTMAVNISALQAQHPSWEHGVRRALAEHGLAARDLVLELTETALLQAANSTLSALRRLREEGVGISLDDFGTGYASLRYLTTLPVSAVKIDRSFTAGLPHDDTSRKIVAAVANLAADLHLDCVIEGIETVDQRDCAPSGVQLQGWLIGRPSAPETLDVLGLMLAGA